MADFKIHSSNFIGTKTRCGLRNEIVRRLEKYERLEAGIRNIIFNVQQNPGAYKSEDLIHSMRSALGLKPGERV